MNGSQSLPTALSFFLLSCDAFSIIYLGLRSTIESAVCCDDICFISVDLWSSLHLPNLRLFADIELKYAEIIVSYFSFIKAFLFSIR